MDPISAAGSVLALVQVTSVLAKAAVSLYENIRDAPVELASVANRVLLLQGQLSLLTRLNDDELDKLVSGDSLRAVHAALNAATENIQEVHALCQQLSSTSQRLRGRIRWALLDRKTLERAQGRLGATETSLTCALQILAVCSQSVLLAKVDGLSQALERTQIDDVPPKESAGPLLAKRTAPIRRTENDYNTDPSISRINYNSVGLLASLVRITSQSHSEWSVAMRFHLPLAQIFGSHAVQAQFAFRTFPLCRSVSFLAGSGMTMAKVVPEHSIFMRACVMGDIGTVRAKFQSGENRPTDITERNWSALALAVGSGNIDLVRLFLDHGAGVNWTFGLNQTSPLQWAIASRNIDVVRLLLQYGASQDHINALGWSPLFFCWPLTRQGEPIMLEYIKLLAEDSFQDLTLLDEDGWTCMHRVAAFGSAEELMQLIKLGADPLGKSLPLGWNTLQHACFYGNVSCYEQLLPQFGEQAISMTDERGWSLLHLAAASGSEGLLRDLLKRGADPQALTNPSAAETMHEGLYGKRCSPRDIAAIEGPEHFLKLDRAIEDLLADDEVFFDAEE